MEAPDVDCPWCGPGLVTLWIPVLEDDGTLSWDCCRCWLPLEGWSPDE